MKIVKLHIQRTDENGTDIGLQTYSVSSETRDTVLHALQYLYSRVDSTLAFRYSCRFKKCGLCGIQISGRARLACLTPLKNEIIVKPLNNLPVIRDLVVDRRHLFDELRTLRIFPIIRKDFVKPLDVLEGYYKIAGCLECLCCHSECSALNGGSGFGGPFMMVKLAQMHFHPLDSFDRRQQSKDLGIERCADCRKCSCPYGINIFRNVITPLLN